MKNVPKAQIIQKHKNGVTLMCTKASHAGQVLKYACTSPVCDQNLLCDLCIKQNHNKNHQENVVPIEDLLIPDFGKNPIKKVKVEGQVKSITSIKDVIISKNNVLKTYSQAIAEELAHTKEHIKQIEETFKGFMELVTKKLEQAYAKILKDFKTQFNIFEYAALRIPKVRKELENFCFKDPKEYKSVITSILEVEKGKNDNTSEFIKNLGEFSSLDEHYKLLTENINLRPISSDYTKLINKLEHEVQVLQQNILQAFPEQKIETKAGAAGGSVSLKRAASVIKIQKSFDYQNALTTESLIAQSRVTALAVIDQKRLVTGSETGILEFWNIKNQMMIQHTQAHNNTIRAIVAINQKTIVSGSRDGSMKVWSLPGLECVKKIDAHAQGLTAMSRFEGTEFLVSAGMDNLWKIWDVETGKMIFSKSVGVVSCIEVLEAQARNKILWEKNFSMNQENKDGLHVIAAGGKKDISLWIVDLNEMREPYAIGTLKGHEKDIRAIMTMNGNVLISTGNDYSIRVWDLKDFSCKKVIAKAHSNFITNLGYIENDVFVSTGCDGVIKFWNVNNGNELRSLKDHKGFIYCLGFDKNSAMVTAGDDQIIRVWK